MKTISLKKVSAIAVASLGFGLLSAVPAFAAAATATAVSPKVSAATVSSDLGTVTFGNITAGAADTYAVNVLTGPAGGVLTIEDLAGNGTDTTHTVGAGASNYTDAGAAGAAGALTVTGKFSLPGTYTVQWGAATTITGTYVVTGQRNSIAVLIADGLAEVAGSATNKLTANGVAGSFNTVTVGVVSGTGVAITGGNTWGTSARRTLVTVSGASATITSATGATVAENKLSAVTNVNNQDFDTTPGALVINTPSVGTITVNSYLESSNAGIFSATADQTVTITVGTTATNGVVSAVKSTLKMGAVATAQDVDGIDDTFTVANGASATAQGANIIVQVKDGLENALTSQTITAVITGPGLLGYAEDETATTTAATARAVSGGTGTNSTSSSIITVWPDKTGAGTSTITISAGTTVLGTKTITFTGDAKVISVGALKPHITVGSAADAVWVLAKDSAGTAVTYSPVATSSATAVVASSLGSCAEASAGEQLLGAPKGSYVCDITGSSVGTATLTIASGSTTTNSPTVAIRVTESTISSVALSTDKPTYAPGEKITLTLTAKDAAGQLIGAGSYDIVNGASTASQALTGTAFADGAVTINAGIATVTYYAPLVTGPFTFTLKTKAAAPLNTAAQGLTLTATATVTDAANDAIRTSLASLNAKIVALNALIAKIMKRLNIR